MIGAVPNPKKNITVDFNIDFVKSRLIFIPNSKDSKYSLTSKNEILNHFVFEATEFLSLGVYIDITLSKLSDTQTSIEIEVRRKVGAFDQSHEVTKANDHIAKILELLSKCLALTDEKIQKHNEIMEEAKSKLPEKKGCMVTILIIVGGLGLGSILMSFV